MRDRRPLPALDKAKKLQSPDLNSIGDKNYTDTILKYGGLATRFVQLDTNAKTIVAAINELYYRPTGSIVVPNPPLPSGGQLETESGVALTTESGEPLEIEGGTSAPSLTSIGIDGDIYKIDGGSGGTTVIPNVYDPTEVLYTLQIDNTIYSIPSHYIIINPPIPAPPRTGEAIQLPQFKTLKYGDDYYRVSPMEAMGVLYSGSTTVSIQCPENITSYIQDLNLDIYTDKYGISPIDVTLSNQTFILTFNEQAEDINVKVRFS